MDVYQTFKEMTKWAELLEAWLHKVPGINNIDLIAPSEMGCWPQVHFHKFYNYVIIAAPYSLSLVHMKGKACDDIYPLVIGLKDTVIEDPSFDPDIFFNPFIAAIAQEDAN